MTLDFYHQTNGIKNINLGFTIGLFLVISIGFVQFGYSLGSFNSTMVAYSRLNELKPYEYPYFQAGISALTALGSCCGSLGAARFSSFGRNQCLKYNNIFVIIGSLMSLFPQNHLSFMVGRFIYGIASGSFGVFVLKYINETAPVEIKGSVGTSAELGMTFGSMATFVLSGVYTTSYPIHDMNEE